MDQLDGEQPDQGNNELSGGEAWCPLLQGQVMDQDLQQLWKSQAPVLRSQSEVGSPGLGKAVVDGWQYVLTEAIGIHQEKFLIKAEVSHMVQESKSQLLSRRVFTSKEVRLAEACKWKAASLLTGSIRP